MGVKAGRTSVEHCHGLASVLYMRPHLQTPLTEKEREMRVHYISAHQLSLSLCLSPPWHPQVTLCAHKHHGVKASGAMMGGGLEDEHPSVFSLQVGQLSGTIYTIS